MAIIITKEPKGLPSIENCVFCKEPTRYWYKERKPVCPKCAKVQNDADLHMEYLDFTKQELGYTRFQLTAENIKANKGKTICFVDKRTIDKYRGYYNVEYGIIGKKHYSKLFIDEFDNSIDIRNIVECGIKIEQNS